MGLNGISLEILAYLRQQADYISIEQLAARCGLSGRAVRYNLQKIEEHLVKKGFPYLEKERLRGVRLPEAQLLQIYVDGLTESLKPYQYSYSAKERVSYILATLLQAGGPVLVEHFCKRLERARGTILKDIDEAEAWFADRGLSLVRRPKVGISVRCDEAARRSALAEVLFDSLEPREVIRYTESSAAATKYGMLQLGTLFQRVSPALVGQAIKRLEGLLELHLSDQAFRNLVLHLAILLERCAQGKDTLPEPLPQHELCASAEYCAAAQIIHELCEPLHVEVPQGEIVYFTYHILGAASFKHALSAPSGGQEENSRLLEIIDEMIARMERIYSVCFGPNCEQLRQGLFIHLRPSIYRLRYNLYLKNPIYEDIQRQYSQLLFNTRLVCAPLESYVGGPINDHEISYIALHFGAALQGLNKRGHANTRVLLVCGSGVGSARLVQSQIEHKFLIEVVDTVSGRLAAQMDMAEVDCIITTIPLPGLAGKPCLKVAPVLTDDDYKALSNLLAPRYAAEAHTFEARMAARLVKIVEDYCQLQDSGNLQNLFLNELIGRGGDEPKGGQAELKLCDLLFKEYIVLGLRCESWQDAIVAGARILEERHHIQPCYTKRIVDNLEKYGPYMQMLPGMVLSHASPEDGVERLGMSMVTLDPPICFGYAEHDPVQVVITLAALDKETHLHALMQLLKMIKSPQGFKALTHLTNKDDIMDIILKFSI